MPTPSQMFTHTLIPLKGWFRMTALDYTTKLSGNVSIDPVYAGRVVHLNSAKQFEMGASSLEMPMFLLQGTDHWDVSNPGGSDWTATAPAGYLTALVATGAYELETTEFDSAQTYNPNEHLRAVASNSDATTGGRITNQTLGTLYASSGMACRCGVVSRGKYTNSYGKTVLAFWSVYIPGN